MAIKNTLVQYANASQIFYASTGTEHAITTMVFCNTSVVEDAYLNLWAVPYGQVPGGQINQILKQVLIPTETFVMDHEKLIIGSQDSIWAQVTPSAANGNVNALVSSVIIS